MEFGLCRVAHLWDALKGHYATLDKEREFKYNVARLSVTSLINVQLERGKKILPSQLWPDWNNAQEPKIELAELLETDSEIIDFVERASKILDERNK